MGWSDISLSLRGPVVQDLRTHFTQRWNFIYDEKYGKKDTRYQRLPDTGSGAVQGGYYPPPPTQQRGFDGEEDERGYDREAEGERGFSGGDYDGQGEGSERGLFGRHGGGGLRDRLHDRVSQMEERYEQQHGGHHQQQQSHAGHGAQRGGAECQITRSVSKWSHNVATEVTTFMLTRRYLLTVTAFDSKCLLRDH
jgi:phospholipase D1/2